MPGLDPSRHTVSEYVNVSYGWSMVSGFAAWAASLAAIAWLMWRPESGLGVRARRAVAALLLIAACGLLLTAVFPTQTIAGILPPGVQRSSAGRLHDVASGGALLALFAATATVALTARRTLIGRVTLGFLVLAVATSVALLAVGPSVAGIRQRALIAFAILWQAALLRALAQSSQAALAVRDLTACSR